MYLMFEPEEITLLRQC